MRELRISRQTLGAITEQARREYPMETCGLLLGHRRQEHTHIVRMYTVANAASPEQRHHFYQIDGKDFLSAEKAAREDELEVVGVFHSHPDQSPVPSKADRELAWEHLSYLIVQVYAEQGVSFRCWRLIEGEFQEEKLVLIDAQPS